MADLLCSEISLTHNVVTESMEATCFCYRKSIKINWNSGDKENRQAIVDKAQYLPECGNLMVQDTRFVMKYVNMLNSYTLSTSYLNVAEHV